MKGGGIEFRPDGEDPKRVFIKDGLPEGVARAEVTFRAKGALPGSRVVRRSRAEFARISATTLDSAGGWEVTPRDMTLGEVAEYLREVQRRLDERDAEIRRRREAVDLRCPWCGVDRAYIGVLGFVTGHPRILTDEPGRLDQHVVQQHAYRCESCGSMAYFAHGYLPHPLPGGHGS